MTQWVRPKYTKLVTHKPKGERRHLRVMAGTQVIDRFWASLRSQTRKSSAKAGSHALRRKVRAAQWLHWNRGSDLWLKSADFM